MSCGVKMKPNENNIKKWCAALRSGKYKQTTGSLQNLQGYCCLGVACKIFISETDLTTGPSSTIRGSMPDEQRHAPKWLKDINESFFNKTAGYLSSFNDAEWLTFDEIADLLEAVYIHKVLE